MPDRSRSPVHPGEPLNHPPRDYAEEERDTWGWRTPVYPDEPALRAPRAYAEDIAVVRRWRRQVYSPGRVSFVTFVTAAPALAALILFLVWRNP